MSSEPAALIRERVRMFIVDTFLYMRPDVVLAPEDAILRRGIVDSMGVMELLTFLEADLGVTVPDADVTEANLGSVERIAAYIVRRLESAPRTCP